MTLRSMAMADQPLIVDEHALDDPEQALGLDAEEEPEVLPDDPDIEGATEDQGGPQ